MKFYQCLTTILLMFIFAFLTGCSGGGSNPVLPGQHDASNLPSMSESSGSVPISDRNINIPDKYDYTGAIGAFNAIGTLGEFELYLDEKTAGAELISARKSTIGESYTLNGAAYFTVNPCLDCLKIQSIELTPAGTIKLTFSISHPFDKGTMGLPPSGRNRLDLDIFDVAIVIAPMIAASRTFPLMNATAYTEICTKMDGFTGDLSNLTQIDTLSPYFLVVDNSRTGLVTNNRFEMGTKDQLVETYFKSGGYFRVHLTMGYGVSAILVSRLDPTYYVPEFNRKSAWKVVATSPNGNNPPAIGNTWDDSDFTTAYNVTVKVYDWQQTATVADPYPDSEHTDYILKASKVQDVSVEIPGMNTILPLTSLPQSGDGSILDPLIYKIAITNENHLAAGTYTGLVRVRDERIPPTGGTAGKVDTLVDSPDGKLLRWYDIPEFATYQTFTATVVQGKRITVTSPNGGENWGIGSAQTITWTWGGTIANVNIELSLDGGLNYTVPIANNIPNIGTFSLNPVGNWPTTHARIRIYNPLEPAVTDQSNADFSIKLNAGPITVTVPNGGESWDVGSSEDITWNADGSITFVKIELSLDSGVTFPMSLTGSTQNDGIWKWQNIPKEAVGIQNIIRISNILNLAQNDVSDADFTVVCPLPPAPSHVMASNGLFPDKVRITWWTVPGALSYNIYRDTLLYDSGIVGAAYDDMAAAPDVHHDYQVSTVTICGEGAPSIVDDGWACTLPTTPTNLVASDGTYPDKVEVTWDSIPQATGYNIFRDSILEQANWTNTTWNDTTAIPGTHYQYSVSAKNGCGESAISPTDEGWRCVLPGIPANVTASNGLFASRVEITWSASAGADSYDIYRDGAPYDSGILLTNYDDTTAVPGTHYQYSVLAVNTCGDSALSSQDEGWRCVLPGIPSGIDATDGTYPDKVEITWLPLGGASSYNVYRDNIVQITGVLGTAWNDTSAVQGVHYQYTVSASNSCGEGDQSVADEGWCCVLAPVPANTLADDGAFPDQVNVSWDPSAGSTGYNVYRDNILQEANWALTSWVDLTMVPGTHYMYAITSLNSCGESAKSVADEGWACVVPDPPNNVQASDGTFLTLVEITWNAVPGATGYNIYRDTIEIQPGVVGTSWQDNTVTGGVVYSYQIQTINPCGVSLLSTADNGNAQGCAADTNDTTNTADHIYPDDVISGCVDMVDVDWFYFFATPNGIQTANIDLTVFGGTAEMRVYEMEPGEAAPGTLLDNNNNVVINNNSHSKYFIRLIGTSGQVGYDLSLTATWIISHLNAEIYVPDDGTGVWPVYENPPNPDEELTVTHLQNLITWNNNIWNQYGYELVWDGTPTMMTSQYYVLDSSAERNQMHAAYGQGTNTMCLYFVDQLESGNTAYCIVRSPQSTHTVNGVFTVYSPNVWHWQDVVAHEHGHGYGYYFDEYLYDMAGCPCGDNVCLGAIPYLFWTSTGCYMGNLMFYSMGTGGTWNLFDLQKDQAQWVHEFHFLNPTNFPFY